MKATVVCVLLLAVCVLSTSPPLQPDQGAPPSSGAVTRTDVVCDKKMAVGIVMDTSASVDTNEIKHMRNAAKTVIANVGSESVFFLAESFGGPERMPLFIKQFEGILGREPDAKYLGYKKLPAVPPMSNALTASAAATKVDAMNVRAGASTDLVMGMSRILDKLLPYKSDLKVMFVLTDGATNVALPGGDALSETTKLIKKAQSSGVVVFVVGIQTEQFVKGNRDRATQCEALAGNPTWGDAGKLRGCLPGVYHHTPEFVSATKNPPDAESETNRGVIKKALDASVSFSDQQAAQIEFFKTNMAPTLQYMTVKDFKSLPAFMKAMVRTACQVLVPSIHFDSDKSDIPCRTVKNFFDCDNEMAAVLKSLEHCPKEKTITVIAHTSSAGQQAYNERLSQTRMTATIAKIKESLPDHQYKGIAAGENNLASSADNGVETSRAAAVNRRAQVSCGLTEIQRKFWKITE